MIIPGKINDMVEYIVSEFSGDVLTRTKLVKLLYLADRESYNKRGRQISNIQYIKYHYGPYSEDIVDTVKKMDGDKIREISGQSSNGTYYQYEPNREYRDSRLTREERKLLGDVLQEYENIQTRKLVERVYELDDLNNVEKYTPLLRDNINDRRREIK